MKKAFTILIAVGTFASGVNADILVSDTFSYVDGSLVGNVGWTHHAGTFDDLLVSSVSSGQAVIQHGDPSEDAHLAFEAVPGKIYYGIDFSVSAPAPISGTDNEYFVHFREGFNFSAHLDVVPASGGGDFSVGIASYDSVADATWATDLSFGTTYRAVVAYDQDANQAELWVDPDSVLSTSILGDDQTDPVETVTSFALRQSDSSLNETIFVDNIVVATTFNEALAIPEPSTYAAIISILTFGFVAYRRRK